MKRGLLRIKPVATAFYDWGVADIRGWLSYKKVWTFDSEFVVLGDCKASVAIIPDEDVARSKNVTLITPPTVGSLSDMFDWDDDSYALWEVPANTEFNAFMIDFGDVFDGFIRIYTSSATWGGVFHRLYGSNDGNTWSLIYEKGGPYGELYAYSKGYKYYKVAFRNTRSSLGYATIYSFEAYPAYSAPYRRVVKTDTEKRVVVVVANGRYQVIELIYL
jgi:hypothetical protein